MPGSHARALARPRICARAAAAAALVAVCFGNACSPARTSDAARLLSDISAGPREQQADDDRPAPPRRLIQFAARGRAHAGDLYTPPQREAASREAGIVLVPGLAPGGKDDPRLVALAEALARADFVVLVPDMLGLRQGRARAADAEPIGDAVLALHERLARSVAEPRLGIAAVSYAVGPAVLAALDPAVAKEVRFVFGVGGYYDIEAVVTYFTTGKFREGPDRTWRTSEPNAYGKWVFAQSNAAFLSDPRDRRLLDAIARRKLENLSADVSDLAAGLGPEGRAVLTLLQNRDPDRTSALIAALPASIRTEMAALDLARRNLADLCARLLLVHGRDDRIIPWTESAKLAAAAPSGLARLFLVDSLAHVDLEPGGLDDTVVLLQAAYALLAERDGATPAPCSAVAVEPGPVRPAAGAARRRLIAAPGRLTERVRAAATAAGHADRLDRMTGKQAQEDGAIAAAGARRDDVAWLSRAAVARAERALRGRVRIEQLVAVADVVDGGRDRRRAACRGRGEHKAGGDRADKPEPANGHAPAIA